MCRRKYRGGMLAAALICWLPRCYVGCHACRLQSSSIVTRGCAGDHAGVLAATLICWLPRCYVGCHACRLQSSSIVTRGCAGGHAGVLAATLICWLPRCYVGCHACRLQSFSTLTLPCSKCLSPIVQTRFVGMFVLRYYRSYAAKRPQCGMTI
jgi:hypothetical protein